MSKSLKRVERAIETAGLSGRPVEMPNETRTAEQAAMAVGCTIDQIMKSIILEGATSGNAYLFLTAGGNQVDMAKASLIAGETLVRADAVKVRAQTGFAIGGVAPIGHQNPISCYIDPRLLEFDEVWAAAGTPRHVFPADPADLHALTGAEIANFTA